MLQELVLHTGKRPHFFGKLPSGGPWAIKREDPPAAFVGRSELILVPRAGIPASVYTSKYPIPPLESAEFIAESSAEKQPAITERISREKIVARYNAGYRTGRQEAF